MSNNNHVINITFVIIQVLYWLLIFGTGADMQLKKKKKEKRVDWMKIYLLEFF